MKQNILPSSQLVSGPAFALDGKGWKKGAGKLIEHLARKDLETGNHVWRVAHTCLYLGQVLNVSERDLPSLWFGSLLHDIGKLIVPDFVLKKPAGLSDYEWEVMRKHPENGRRLLEDVSVPPEIWVIAAQHHERWDGGGYPSGLRGSEIHFHARIFAVADAFDALTSNRCYRPAAPFQIAAAEIASHAGTQFDRRVVEAFLLISPAEWQSALAQFEFAAGSSFSEAGGAESFV